MQSVNKLRSDTRHQIARLAALTLVFSYAELLVPRVIPFFRLGLGNTALLMGLGLSFPAFMLLSVIKSVAVSLMAGTLFSPFFLVSLAQSFVSALVMFGLGRVVRRHALLSLYGISVLGSAVSAGIQISLSSLYLGQGTWSLLGPMLIFNTVSGVITAWLAGALNTVVEYPRSGCIETTAVAGESQSSAVVSIRPSGYSTTGNHRLRNISFLTIILAAASVFFIKNTVILGGLLLLSFLAQKISGRKILLLPHISLWLFVLITSVFVPNGRVLFTVAGFSITEGAALSALQKALRLSIVSALSQTAATIKLASAPDSLLALTLAYYGEMSDTFRKTPGSIITKLKSALR